MPGALYLLLSGPADAVRALELLRLAESQAGSGDHGVAVLLQGDAVAWLAGGDSDEATREFESGVFVIALRITDSLGETDEANEPVRLYINYNNTDTRVIGSGTHEHDLPVNDLGLYAGGNLRYIQLRLEYDAGGSHGADLDLYLYNLTGEEVARNETHDTSQAEQVNTILLEYHNSTHNQWFDEEGELGDWTVEVVHQRSWGADPEYTLWMDVIYWEE